MIVRILHEGQYLVDDEQVSLINAVDERVAEAIDRRDSAAFATGMAELVRLVRLVRSHGTAIAPEELVPSDAVLPPVDASLVEVRSMLGADVLVPGS